MGVGGVGKGSGNVLRKYRRMTVACSSAISYVASENVVHSIERSKSVSDSSGGGWRLMIEGKVSDSGGSPWMDRCSSEPKKERIGQQKNDAYAEHFLNCTFCSDNSHPFHIQPVFVRPCER